MNRKIINLLIAGVIGSEAWGQVPPPPPPPLVQVAADKELFITNKAVIASDLAKPGGAWHFREALKRIAGDKPDGSPVDIEQFAEAWFSTWEVNEKVEGSNDTFVKRPAVAESLRSAWKEDRIRLIAIVNRLDLTKFGPSNFQQPTRLGEGRFIYEVVNADGASEPFTLIFEYGLPGDATQAGLQEWARDWHALGQFHDFDGTYLTALKKITDRFSAHGTLNQIRTNEFIARPWEMREFNFDSANRLLRQIPVAVTPDMDLNDKSELRTFIQGEAEVILAGQHESVPLSLAAAVAPVPLPDFTWRSFGANDPADLRRAGFIVSFNTCSGCHAGDTGTVFQHAGKNAPDLSPFLKGEITLAHPLPGKTEKTHNEMEIRKQMLRSFLTGPDAFDDPDLKANIRSRANRVH